MRNRLVILTKAPRAGAVKTRLGAGVGYGRATAIFRSLLQRTIAEAKKGDWQTSLAVDPTSALTGFNTCFDPSLPRFAQGKGDLGDRMARIIRNVPPGPVIMIGADAPAMRARHLKAAFDCLRGADAVFGPAEDGGYWLIGLARRRAAPDLFHGVRWSSSFAMQDTIATLPKDYRIMETTRLFDVDEAHDLDRVGPRTSA